MKYGLPRKMENWLQAALASERFSSEEEALEYLVDLDMPLPDCNTEKLKRLWREGIESGAPVDGPIAMAEIFERVGRHNLSAGRVL